MATFGSAVFGAAVFGGTVVGLPVQAGPKDRLEDDVLGTLTLTPDHGYLVRTLDLGFPEARAVVAPRINANGVDDRTALHGARVVSFTVDCFPPADGSASRWSVVERLRAYAHPARRPSLVFVSEDGRERRVTLRGEPPSWPISLPGLDQAVQMVFTAPSGLLEDNAVTTVTVPAVPALTGGRSYPLRYPRTYPRGSVAGAVPVTNGEPWGAPTDFVARLWGPCTGPALVNVTTGATLSLPGLALTAEQYAEVDVREATIRLNGRANETLYGYQAWGVSSFWQLVGGVNQVRYAPDSYDDASARAEITFRPAVL